MKDSPFHVEHYGDDILRAIAVEAANEQHVYQYGPDHVKQFKALFD